MVRQEMDKHSSNVQAREHMARNVVRYVTEISAKKKSIGQKKKRSSAMHEGCEVFMISMQKTRNSTETLIAKVREKLEGHMVSAMPCKLRKTDQGSTRERKFEITLERRDRLQSPRQAIRAKLFTHAFARPTS